MKNKKNLILLAVFFSLQSFGQKNNFDYKRQLLGKNDQWNKILLPDEIYEHTMYDFSNVRVLGITSGSDTIEAPYILNFTEEKIAQQEVTFRLINKSKNENGSYFTFEVVSNEPINEIKLEFKEQNFDWRVKLEGSQNLTEWFSILENYRMLSIKNEFTNFQFTKLLFPNSKYRYFRLNIKENKSPVLTASNIFLNKVVEGNFKNYRIRSKKIEEEKKNKETIIHIDLNSVVPICKLKILVKDTFDYYRPITIQYLSDSAKTEKGWIYNYNTLSTGTLNSLEKNEFKFSSTLVKSLKIVIENQDNSPLKIDSLKVMGYQQELIVRFNEPAAYYLFYGGKNMSKPNYDIARFENKIPEKLIELNLGEEQIIQKEEIPEVEPLFQNKIWLWSIMVFIILLLGWFSLSMLKNSKKNN